MDDVPNPYKHSNAAKHAELKGNLRDAERSYKLAIEAADALPLEEYSRDFKAVRDRLNHGESEENEYLAGADLPELVMAYRELLSLPFLTRSQLAGFYARQNALPEAKELIEEALKVEVDRHAKDEDFENIRERVKELQRNVSDTLGPRNAEELFLYYFDKLDIDKNGFVDEAELKRAQFDLSIEPEAQSLIRYLLQHYLDIEKANQDEILIDISGISRADVQKYQAKSLASWKRLNNQE